MSLVFAWNLIYVYVAFTVLPDEFTYVVGAWNAVLLEYDVA